MDLKQLEYFVRVAEMGSFTHAAAALGMAQSALSRQVRLLEVELRQNLLVRNGRGVTPTEAGRLLVDHGPSSVARAMAVPLMRAFRKELPEARLSISEGLSSELLRGLVSGRLDIVVLYNGQPVRDVDVSHLMDEDLLLVRARPRGLAEDPPPGPIALAELARLPLVIPSRPNAIRMHVEAEMALIGCRPEIALEIDGVAAILDMVADGAGYAVLPRNALLNSPVPSAYSAQVIGAPPLRIALSLATSLQRPATQVQKTTLDLVRLTVSEVLRPA
jgi:LysR family nitrogen assimilation transcriptional regulator